MTDQRQSASAKGITLYARLDKRTQQRVLCGHRDEDDRLCECEFGYVGPRQPEGTADPCRATRILQLHAFMGIDDKGIWGMTEQAKRQIERGHDPISRQKRSLDKLFVNGWVIGPEDLPALIECPRCRAVQWLTCDNLILSLHVPYMDVPKVGRQYTVTELTPEGTKRHYVGTRRPPRRGRRPIIS